MALLLLAWIYHFFLISTLGLIAVRIIGNITKQNLSKLSILYVFFIGLALLSFVLEFSSFFIRINWEIHAFVIINVLTGTYIYRDSIFLEYSELFRRAFGSKISLSIVSFVGVFILYYGSDGPVYNLDPGRYHFQLLNWAMHYPVVPGLANLHDRFGGLGAWQLIHAMSEIGVLKGKTYHVFNSLLLFLFSSKLIFVTVRSFLNKVVSFVELCQVYILFGVLYYWNFIVYWFISSLTPDWPNILVCIICFLFSVEHNDKIKRLDKFYLTTLFLLCFSGFAYKLSALFLGALLIYPIIMILKDFKSYKGLFFSMFLCGIMVYGTHLTKNTIQTGWPLFPVTKINFGSFDWQYPKEKTDGMAACISHDAFAPEKSLDIKGLGTYIKLDKFEYFKIWFTREIDEYGFVFWIIIISLVLALLYLFVKDIQIIFKRYLNVIMALLVCLFFWLTNAPDIRFGLGYLLVYIAVLLAVLTLTIFQKKYVKIALGTWLIILFCFSLVRSTKVSIAQSRLFYPLDLISELLTNESVINLKGIPKTKFYNLKVSDKLEINLPLHDQSYSEYGRNNAYFLPHYNDSLISTKDSLTQAFMKKSNESNKLVWFLPLPATHYIYDELELRGGDLSSGFRFNRSKTKKK